ncbi:hypothetical protein CYMTET_13501 [Cymbomonas tetramitiformis]|uniref:Uncharacterized protein n=1 Tax=Cymbomonas tetramitiformis TaxID=36881 RepID=A0AAE0GIB4_9CHLO|nr:hypothetical protein CYMTET_13501 [Cymbomonas tetramitiformis]
MQLTSRSLPRSRGISSLPHKLKRPSSSFSCTQRSSRYSKAPQFYSHVNINASVAKEGGSSSQGPNSETDDTHRLAYNKAFEFFQVKIDNELVEWTGPYYDTLVNVAEGGKMRWHFNNNTWPTFSTEGCTFGEIASADCVEVQDELILILQDKKTELYNDIVSHAGKSEEEVQLIARIQSLEKQLTETAEASSQKVKELQAELEARTSGSLSEALPTEQNAELRAQIRRLEEVSSEDLAEYEAQEVQLTARIQSLENQLIETAEASAQELKELQAELEARTSGSLSEALPAEQSSELRAQIRRLEEELAERPHLSREDLAEYEAQTVARIQTMMVEEQLQSVQSAEREPDLAELEQISKLRMLVRQLEKQEVQLTARIQSLEKQLTETAEASCLKVKELQAELEARTSGSLSEALPTEQSEALPTEQNAELRAQIRRLEEVSSEDLAEYEAQELQLTARIQSLENQLIETAEASAQELKELQAELEARTSGSLSEALPAEQSSELRAQIRRLEEELAESPHLSREDIAEYEAQTVARIQTMMVEEQLQSVQSAEREPDLLVELEETTKLRALVRRLETQMADMVTRDELKLEEAKVLALTLDTKDK